MKKSARLDSINIVRLLLVVAILCAVNIGVVQGGRRFWRRPPSPQGRPAAHGICPRCGGYVSTTASTAVNERKNSASTTPFSDLRH
ncbi:hypothetical protein CFC21_004912 [Triticum aestivum]|uniref:Uncharacterized protein n=2 Tax=Triticum aestivum TaxID=4565 RepID=A0A9R1D8J5_WHEAT|nr:hypothetical protein CFC21_004912 [Triticum aestivum]